MKVRSSNSQLQGKTVLSCVVLGIACFFLGRLSVRDSARSQSQFQSGRDQRPTPEAKITAGPAATQIATSASTVETRAGWDENRWHETNALPASPAQATTLAALLENLAATEPQQSMALAQAEPNLVLREILVQATLRGWAKSSPSGAASWALAQPVPSDRETGLMTVFSSAVAVNPEEAVRTGKSIINKIPGEAVSYGGHLIDALCQAGDFLAAAEFASAGNESTRPFWMGEAYAKWASFQPQSAAHAAATISDPTLRAQALRGVVGGWAMADPASLIQYVTALPAAAEKPTMISQALQRWVKTDPIAASEWINNKESSPELDSGIASVATMESLKPDVAVSWAESIVSSKIRSETLVSVLRNWATMDLIAAKNYFDRNQDLLPEDRTEIAGVIATLRGRTTSP